ncbi:putative homeobox and c2h2 transcription protein [Lasiodiplodia theobromae]|uniref:Homeobox and c2h2 transcription protein n=1 Tax=Lasiodiplodia theobromae TaxID=45133 RepID=A0A8H7IS81_9PEZI|nr:putative homeobox and c2h2 transcription protein [Lasiodiplodia theobromae]
MDHPPHDDDMQAYFPPQSHQWADPMQVDDHAEAVPWNYGCSASNWWLPQDSHDQFNHLAAFPGQQGGPWTVDQYPPAQLDFQGAHFQPPTFEPIQGTGQLIPDDELDGLLNPHPSSQAGFELGRPELQARQRVRQRISSPAKAILQQWFDDHIEDPYLEREDVSTLSEATGLTPRQVRTFFANARARKLPAPLVGQQSPPALSSTEAKASGAPSNKPKQPAASKTPCPRQQSPMQRYLSSSPEDEGVSEEALRHAAAASQANTACTGSAPHRNPDALSEAASSNSSSSSRASIDSAVNRVPRRGRKRHRGSLRRGTNTVVRERVDQSKIFQCTFCNRDFAQKYDWRRHEESVHIPQKEWICMPDGAVRTDAATGLRFCVFCEQQNPSNDHLQRHNHAPCLAAPQASRTFTRKDKLIQHLGQVHKQAQMSPTMQSSWCRRVARHVAIACGICGVRLFSWNERVEHISTHFVDGLDMRYWLGAPGGVVSLTPPSPAAPPTTTCGSSSSPSISTSSSSSSLPSTASVDPLFPAYTPPLRSSAHRASPSSFHSCTSCSNRFSRYADTVFHERQVHRMYKPRPQPTEDGGNIANFPLVQQQSHAEQQQPGGQRPPD